MAVSALEEPCAVAAAAAALVRLRFPWLFLDRTKPDRVPGAPAPVSVGSDGDNVGDSADGATRGRFDRLWPGVQAELTESSMSVLPAGETAERRLLVRGSWSRLDGSGTSSSAGGGPMSQALAVIAADLLTQLCRQPRVAPLNTPPELAAASDAAGGGLDLAQPSLAVSALSTSERASEGWPDGGQRPCPPIYRLFNTTT